MQSALEMNVLSGLVLTAINHALSLDPHAADKLAPLDGKVVRLEIEHWTGAVWVLILGGRLSLLDSEAVADVALEGNLGGYVGLFRGEKQAGDRLKMSGDVHDAQALQSALKGLKPDVNAVLVEKFGAVRGEKLYHALHKLRSTGQSALDLVRTQVRQIQQECWVSQSEYQSFEQRTAQMMAALAALEAKYAGIK